MNNAPRNKTLHQSAEERIHNFKEVNLGFDDALMLEEASRIMLLYFVLSSLLALGGTKEGLVTWDGDTI